MLLEYLKLSFQNLSRRKMRSWLTMIGIFIGIAAVVSLIGLGEGLRSAVIGQFGFLGTDILSVRASGLALAGPPGSGTPVPLADDLAEKIEKINGVEAAFNRYIESATLEFNDRSSIGMAVSVPGGDTRKIFEEMVNLKADQGRLLREGDGKKVLLGNDFTKDDVFGKGVASGDRVLINSVQFEVVGILEKKGSFIFDSAVMVNEDVMLDTIRGDDGTTDIIAVKVKNEAEISRITEDIEKLLRKERDVDEGKENFNVQTPQQAIESLNSVLFAVQLFVTIIAVISLLVGGIGIMNTMYTSVLERTKEIGILKSIGAPNSAIFTLFFMESGLLGSVGGCIGIILGLALSYGFAFIGQLALGSDLIQAKASLSLIFGSLLFSFILGTAFGVMPAVQASRLQPVDSLRSTR